jgi:predicted ATPase
MIFKIENLGIIGKAKVDLSKDLILLCGHNNTGKSYLAYGLYHFLTFNNEQVLTNLTNYEVILNRIVDHIGKIEIKNNQIVVSLIEIFKSCLNPYKKEVFENVLKQYVQGLGDFFAVPSHNTSFSATKADIEISDKEIENRIRLKGNEFMTFSKNAIQEKSTAYQIFTKLINTIFDFHAYIAPAERSAINIFSKELSLTKNKLFNLLLKSNNNTDKMLDLLRNRVNRYPKPLRDNLEIAEDLLTLSRKESEFDYLANELEQRILKGKIHISPEGDVKYIPNNAPLQNLEIYLTASVVKSLANLVFYLRYLAKARDYIIIDEPELNLHPDNQILMARFLGRLVNEGFKVITSIHSDYIIREMNNLIMLSKPDEKTAGLIKQYGYAENYLLKPEQIGAYLFKEDSQRTEIIKVKPSGLEIETIDNVVDDLNESSEGIYFGLFD